MYNRYFSWEPETPSSTPPVSDPIKEPSTINTTSSTFEEMPQQEPSKERKAAGGLRGLFGDVIKLPDFDADTVLLLILVYFLVSDDQNEHISDTLLIIGILLLLGF